MSPSPPAVPEKNGDDTTEADARKVGITTLIVHHSITVLILVLFLGLGVWSYLNFQNTDFFASVDRVELEAQLQPSLESAQQSRLEVALEVYALLNDRYPTRFEELVNAGLLLPSDLYYPRGPQSWLYEPHADGFTLESRPPDNSQ